MLTFNIYNLSPEQIEQIATYRSRWEQIARRTEPIDREQAASAINQAYEFIDRAAPNIIFFNSPDEALSYILREIKANWGKLNPAFGNPVAGDIIDRLLGGISKEIRQELLTQLKGNLDNGLANRLAAETADKMQANDVFSLTMANFREMALVSNENSQVDEVSKAMSQLFFDAGFIFNNYMFPAFWEISSLFNSSQENNTMSGFSMLFTGRFEQRNAQYKLPQIEVASRFINVIVPSVMADYSYYIDYCHEVLGFNRDEKKWRIFSDLTTNCGWIFPYEKTVLICDR